MFLSRMFMTLFALSLRPKMKYSSCELEMSGWLGRYDYSINTQEIRVLSSIFENQYFTLFLFFFFFKFYLPLYKYNILQSLP